MKPAIGILAYNRPASLRRLLRSIASGVYPDKIHLIISIDFGGEQREKVLEVADSFEWVHGDKQIIDHRTHIGPKAHFHFVGSLAKEHGSIIRLEDDHFVSPMFYQYASKALDFYKDDPRVAGISLYNVWFNGITKEPFIPYLDDGDNYFMQAPWSHGQAYRASQWESYDAYCRQEVHSASIKDALHPNWAALDDEEWIPDAARFLVETNRYYVFPRESLCTNFGEKGFHFKKSSPFFQVPLQTHRQNFRFPSLDDSLAVYDVFQEMMPDRMTRLSHHLEGFDFEMDLNGTKARSNIRHPYVVTSQPCRSPVRTWGLHLFPREANIVAEIPGTELKLCRKEDLRPGGYAGSLARFHRYEYAQSRLSVGLKRHALFWTIRQAERMMGWIKSLLSPEKR